MKIIVEAKDITKVFGSSGNIVTVLHGVDLTVEQGEFVGIMGPSGSGKTTLLNILATIDQPTSGAVVVDGKDVLKMSEDELSAFRRNKLGFIFQDYNLLDTLTVKENIMLPLALARLNVAELERRVADVADQFDLQPILDKYPYQISGGQKQRTAASRSVISKPSLILADEPTGALDSRSATDLLEALKQLNAMHTATILMVTHDSFAASYCSRVLFIKDGNIFTQIVKGSMTRKAFYENILDVLHVMGGSAHESV